MRRLLPLVLALLVLAGCVQSPTDAASMPDATWDVSATLAPVVDAKATLSELKAFSEKFPMRRGDNAAHNAAREHLLKGFQDAGLEAFKDELVAPVSAGSTPTNIGGSGKLVNIVGIKWGESKPEEWIVVGSHYDVTDGAVYGAYDDGSGTLIVQKLAQAFASTHTARTLVFVNFDGEEQGLKGSSHMVEAMSKGEWAFTNGTIVGMIDFDMAGITHPAPAALVADVRSPEMKAILQNKSTQLGFPEGKVQYRAVKGGSSDNGPFKAVEIPSVLLISDFDETSYGQLNLPVSYPLWHKADTYEGMEQLAGGAANLEKGFQNVIDLGSDLLWQMAGDVTLTFE